MPTPPDPGPVCDLATAGGASRDVWGGAAIAARRASHPPGFGWIILQRHGRRPLAVSGRVLLRGDNRCAGLPWWSMVTIYETALGAAGQTPAGAFAVALCHTPAGADGQPWHDAWLADDADAVRSVLERHDPLRAMPVAWLAATRDGVPAPHDAVAAAVSWRFAAAWAGLLGALFGLRRPPTQVAPA